MEIENQVYKTPWESVIKDVKKDVEKSTDSVSSKSLNQSSWIFYPEIANVWPTDIGTTVQGTIQVLRQHIF